MMHYALLTVTTATLVTAFSVVGSILVIGMLIIPPATAFFVTRRLAPMITLSVLFAVSAAILGHASVMALPTFANWAFGIKSLDIISSGTIVLVAAGQLVVAMLFGGERGILIDRFRGDADTSNQTVASIAQDPPLMGDPTVKRTV